MPKSVDRMAASLSAFSLGFTGREIPKPHQPKMPESTTSIGIDFGTTYTYISIINDQDKNPKIILKHPSVVLLTSSQATPKDDADPRNHISGFKQLMGRKYSDPFIHNELKFKAPYKIVQGPDGYAWVETTYGKKVSPVYMLANFIASIKSSVESSLGKRFSKAVMSSPSVFSDEQCKAVWKASLEAGFDEVKSLNEPNAAAVAYGLLERKGLYGIVCIGGGSFSVSVKRVTARRRFDMNGKMRSDSGLGGEEFIRVLKEYLMREFKRENPGFGITPDFLSSFRQVTEQVLVGLSDDVNEVEFVLPPYPPEDWPLPHEGLASREVRAKVKMSVVKELIDGVKGHCESVLVEAGVNASDIDEVVLVGGMAGVPMIQKAVSEVFGKMPMGGVNPVEAIALGIASWSLW